jgi:hypothetical protein
MKIIQLAYHGKEKEKMIRQLAEENSRITYTVLRMKSSSNLGGKLLSEKSDMEFVAPQSIIQISASERILRSDIPQPSARQNNFMDPLLSLLSKGAQAEAGAK